MGEEMGDNRMKLGRGVVVEELGEPLSPQQTRKEKMNIININRFDISNVHCSLK